MIDERYLALKKSQNNRCAACDEKADMMKLDHSSPGGGRPIKYYGLLCMDCLGVLYQLQSDPEKIVKVKAYMQRTRS